jgi:SAM-dependent methyltransferase
MSDIYKEFADIYTTGPYMNYSTKMANFFPYLLEDLNIKGKNILDIACGNGNFLIQIHNYGFYGCGIDLSEKFINHAKKIANKNNLNIEFHLKDIVNFSFEKKFDIATCWFDSLNYILEKENLLKVFKNTYDSLKKNGHFIFDMNTIYGFANVWTDNDGLIQQNTDKTFEVHFSDYDFEKNLASLEVVFFKKTKSGTWKKYTETHFEKGYKEEVIDLLLKESGFKKIQKFSKLNPLIEYESNSPRIYYMCKK